MPLIISGKWVPYTPHGEMRYNKLASLTALTEQEVAASMGGSARDVTAPIPATVSGPGTAPTSTVVYTVPQFDFLHAVAVLRDPADWAEYNQRAPAAYRMPSYSVYLELTYQDLLESVGMSHSPCQPARQTGFSGNSGVNLGSGPDSPYCEAYNLVITSR